MTVRFKPARSYVTEPPEFELLRAGPNDKGELMLAGAISALEDVWLTAF